MTAESSPFELDGLSGHREPTSFSPASMARGESSATRGVLHIINGEHYAGAERVQDLLAWRLPEVGYHVGFACIRPAAFDAARRTKSAPLYAAGMKHKLDLRPAWRLAKIVRDENYRLIHSHTARSALIASVVARLTGRPWVHHVHSPAARDTTNRWNNLANRWLESMTLHRPQGVIAVSNSLGKYLHEMGLPYDRVVVVPNGVPGVEALADRPVPRGTWTLGCVALFRPRKGLEVLLEAMARLVDEGHDVRLRAVGKFETTAYHREMLVRADRLKLTGRIDWRGFQPHPESELRQMDLLVLPSQFGEGMPMVVLEAMAGGVPVVATRVEGVPEVIRDRVDGLLVEPGDADSLADGIRQLIRGELDWTSLRKSAQARQLEGYSDRSMAAHVAQVYDAVLDGRPIVHSIARTNLRPALATGPLEPRTLNVLGVTITDLPFADGVAVAQAMLEVRAPRPFVLNFVNAHTLNCACEAPDYRETLNRSDMVLADGTGVRWAARLQNIRLRGNLNGTDLLPALFDASAGLGYRYYLLGSDPHTIQRTAEVMRKRFPSWREAGHHHGYLTFETEPAVIDEINRAEPHLLLVGMGNPLQEQWIDAHRDKLNVRLCMGVGGLFDYLAGKNRRAPRWIRGLGCEWLHVAATQHRKLGRYLFGNPKFLSRILREHYWGSDFSS